MKNYDENINNLTTLWKTVGTLAGSYTDHRYFHSSLIRDAQWPNRIWMEDAVNEDLLIAIKHFLEKSGQSLKVSYWGTTTERVLQLFDQTGFSPAFEQVGMSLHLSDSFKCLDRVRLKKITDTDEASIWEALYEQSFGYVISTRTITLSMAHVTYYLIYLGEKAIGTVIVFETESTAGFHGMGIIPAYRKHGFAEEAMCHLLNGLIHSGKTLITLQASAMGRNIYKSIGFSEDFLMTTFTLN